MTWRTRHRIYQRAWGFWALMHPGPSLATATAFVLCVLIAAHGVPSPGRLALTTLGMVCMQFAISALNDYHDRQADALSAHKRKPLVLGVVAPGVALALAIGLAAAMVALYAPFGVIPVLTALVGLSIGFSYDMGLKATPLSGVMLGLAFPIIPLLAWEIFASVTPALFWTFPIALALGIGIHLADALPDVEADTSAGTGGLATVLGAYAAPVCWGSLALAGLLIAGLPLIHATPTRPFILLPAEALALALLVIAIYTFHNKRISRVSRLRRHFVLCIGVGLVLAVGWLASSVA
jgi:4-hydroxybenzoate polyprenyltransferase